jgi:hypothetical protein
VDYLVPGHFLWPVFVRQLGWHESQSDVNALDPKGGAFGWHPFNSADTVSALIYPDLSAQKVFILPLRTVRKTYSGTTPKFSCLRKTKS